MSSDSISAELLELSKREDNRKCADCGQRGNIKYNQAQGGLLGILEYFYVCDVVGFTGL